MRSEPACINGFKVVIDVCALAALQTLIVYVDC